MSDIKLISWVYTSISDDGRTGRRERPAVRYPGTDQHRHRRRTHRSSRDFDAGLPDYLMSCRELGPRRAREGLRRPHVPDGRGHQALLTRGHGRGLHREGQGDPGARHQRHLAALFLSTTHGDRARKGDRPLRRKGDVLFLLERPLILDPAPGGCRNGPLSPTEFARSVIDRTRPEARVLRSVPERAYPGSP